MAPTVLGIKVRVLTVTHKTCSITSLPSPPSSLSVTPSNSVSPCSYCSKHSAAPGPLSGMLPLPRIFLTDFLVSFKGGFGIFTELKQATLVYSYFFLEDLGFPWWHTGQGSACQCGEHGFNPCSWKIPYAVDQPSPGAATTESECCSYRSPCS